ncbi:unnamed protein product [Mytilus coruscus]|uniref:Uncharacterized protein n=1 Tax=Mytilus coruscus TaxID=42192 RepID=A0A6J8C6M8_MYTCO|nr:unnamed protein product [Mytilus coruscus]
MVLPSEINNMLDIYKNKKNTKELDYDVLNLQLRFRDLNIYKTKDLQSLSMNKLMTKFYPIRINMGMQKVLKEVFGLSYEQSAGFDYHIGKGYNIFKDSASQFSPLLMQEDDKGQYGLPANVNLKECSSFEIKCESIKDSKDYVNQRLRELQIDIDGDINYGAFNLQVRNGYNKSNESSKSTAQTLDKSSFSVEHRIQKVVVKTPFKITDEFKIDINALPANYDLKMKAV